jgi:SAM-dependent methyltransferase
MSSFDFKINTPLAGKPGTISLDLGSGPRPRNPFSAESLWGIDIENVNLPNILTADLNVDALPFSECALDFVTAFDFIEHVPRLLYSPQRRYPFVELMNEISRVLKPGGMFLSVTPFFPQATVFVDPTHVNFITKDTWKYFDTQFNWAKMYGYKGNLSITYNDERGEHLLTIFRKER